MRVTSQSFWSRRRRRESVGRRRLLWVERLEDRRMLAGRAADAVNAFAFDLYEQMQREQGNLFFSPLSIATALSMAYAGAAGQTAAEMEQVLHLGTEPGIHDAFAELLESLDTRGRVGPQLEVANAMWPQIGLPVEDEFLATIEEDYGGHVQALDYSNPAAAEDVINDWVEAATNGKIQDLVNDLTPSTAMVLTNSVYFKAHWRQPFNREYTAPGDFTLDDGTLISTPMMLAHIGASKANIEGFDVLEISFDFVYKHPVIGGRDVSIVFVLPPRNGDRDLSSSVYAQIDAWLDGPQDLSAVEFELPKFKTEISTNLNDVLAGLGMPTAFELGAADFSGITPDSIAIDTVFHKTYLELNEEGTEAAAATEVGFLLCFAKGTPVLTPDGEKPIDELQVGDLVLARDEGNLEGELHPKRIEAVFRNEAAIVELRVGGQVTRTTAEHPFFVRRRGWTPAAAIRPGDSVSTDAAGWIAVDDVRATSETVPVYNMRVADYHTYFVGSAKWGFAVWVHNSCIDQFSVDRSFHLLIRDNTTSTILFMGRINDPQQLQNEVTPTVVQASADFDGNSVVDGNDFLMWQRGLGRTTGAAHHDGDSDQDGDVDAADLGHWARSFGRTYAPPPSSLPAVATEAPLPAKARPAALSADSRDAAFYLHAEAGDSRPAESRLGGKLLQLRVEDFASAFDDPSFPPTSPPQVSGRRSSWGPNQNASRLGSDRATDSLTLSLAADNGVRLPPIL